MKRADDIFVGETYSKLINLMQSDEKNQTFDPGFDNLESSLGKNKALTVILDSNSNYFSPGSVDSEYQGFLGMIKPPGSFPITTTGTFELLAGN
jgi:hypothetical protein